MCFNPSESMILLRLPTFQLSRTLRIQSFFNESNKFVQTNWNDSAKKNDFNRIESKSFPTIDKQTLDKFLGGGLPGKKIGLEHGSEFSNRFASELRQSASEPTLRINWRFWFNSRRSVLTDPCSDDATRIAPIHHFDAFDALLRVTALGLVQQLCQGGVLATNFWESLT